MVSGFIGTDADPCIQVAEIAGTRRALEASAIGLESVAVPLCRKCTTFVADTRAAEEKNDLTSKDANCTEKGFPFDAFVSFEV